MELLPNSACQRLSKLELECTFGKTKEGQSALGQVHCRIQFSSVWTLSRIQLFVTPWTAARQAFLSITNSRSLLKLMSIESVMPSNHLILCHPLLLPPSIFPSIRVFSNESVLLDYHRIPDLSSLNLCHTANFHWLSSLLTVYVSMLRWH